MVATTTASWAGGTTTDLTTPTTMVGMDANVEAIGPGQHDTTCLVQSGAPFCTGRNSEGQLGNGTAIDSNVAVPVVGTNSSVTAIAAGVNHSCAVDQGAARCWGEGKDGQLGNAASDDSLTPVAVNTLVDKVSDITVGVRFSCAIRDGAAYCWGSNSHGQLGIGSTGGTMNVPQPVLALSSGTTRIVASYQTACAVQNGGVQCWGKGSSGQIGNGVATKRVAVPTQVHGLESGVVAIAMHQVWDGGHVCALKANGTLWCWGKDVSGQLGWGRTMRADAPIEVFYVGAPVIHGLSGGSDQLVDAILASDQPTVSWLASKRATSYQVTIRDASDQTDVCGPTTVAAPATNHAFAGCNLAPMTNYLVTLTATNGTQTKAARNDRFTFRTIF